MSSMKENLILKAVTQYSANHNSFRNRHLAALAGVDRQDVNYYLKKWSKGGYVSKNPLMPGEWILVDLPGLVESLSSSAEPVDLAHAKKHPLFIDTELQKLRNLTDIYAALKVLKKQPSDLRKTLEDYIDEALKELRTERSYMHRKTFSKKRAAGVIQKHSGVVAELGYDVEDILGIDLEVKALSHIGNAPEPEPEEDIDPLLLEHKKLCALASADYNAGKNVQKYTGPLDSLYKRLREPYPEYASHIQDFMTSIGI
jgi:hypothetical protein